MDFMGKKQKIIALLFIILGIVSLTRTVFILWNDNLPDFSTRYDSGILLMQDKNPYTNTASFTTENYPPSALTLLLPFSLLSYSVASKLWIMLSILAFFLLFTIIYRTFPIKLMQMSIIFFLTVISFPFKFTLGMGQVNILILLFIVLFLTSLIIKKKVNAALALSIAVVMKLFPVVYFLSLILHRQWKVFFVASTLIIVFLLLPVMLFGKEISMHYLTKYFFPLLSGSPTGAYYYNQSVTGFLSRIDASSVILISRIIFVIVTVFVFFKKRANNFLNVSLLTVLVLLINNFTWQHHLILLMLPYYFILVNTKSKLILSMTFISYILVAFNIKDPSLFSSTFYGNIFLSHGFFGMLILWVILLFQNVKIISRQKV